MFTLRRERFISILTSLKSEALHLRFGIAVRDYTVRFVCQVEAISTTIFVSDILASVQEFSAWYDVGCGDAVDLILIFLENEPGSAASVSLEPDAATIKVGSASLVLNCSTPDNGDDLIDFDPPTWNPNEAAGVLSTRLEKVLSVVVSFSETVEVAFTEAGLRVTADDGFATYSSSLDISGALPDPSGALTFNSGVLHDFVRTAAADSDDAVVQLSLNGHLFAARHGSYAIYVAPLL